MSARDVSQVAPCAGRRRAGHAGSRRRLAVDDLGHQVVAARVRVTAGKLRGPPVDRQPEPRRLRSVFAVSLEVTTLAYEKGGGERPGRTARRQTRRSCHRAGKRPDTPRQCRRLAPNRIADARNRRQEDNPRSSKVSRRPLRYLPDTLGRVLAGDDLVTRVSDAAQRITEQPTASHLDKQALLLAQCVH